MKFGGDAVNNGEKILCVTKLLKSYKLKSHEIVCIFSAINGMTDDILNAAEYVRKGDIEMITEFISNTKATHTNIIEQSIVNRELRTLAHGVVDNLIKEMESVLKGLAPICEVTPRSLDYLLSFGERLLTPIVSFALKDLGIESTYLTGKEAGIVTDSNFGEARPLMDTTKIRVRLNLEPLISNNVIPLIAGFLGADQNGCVTTLGRGGSDYTATIIGASIDAQEVWLWGNVDGLLTADPKIVKDAKVIKEMSFSEAVELVLFGAKYMHPRALEPVMDTSIPVRMRNAFHISHKGTLIIRNPSKSSNQIVKSVIAIRHNALIDVSGGGMIGSPGTAAKIFEALAKKKVNIMMISQSPSESSISMVVKRDDLDIATTTLDLTLLGKVIKNVKVNDNVSVIAVVGSGMRGIKGVAARVFNAVAEKGINVIMIAQGSSELNLAFAVHDNDSDLAVIALHDAFNLSKISS
jgi:aspartate kinase